MTFKVLFLAKVRGQIYYKWNLFYSSTLLGTGEAALQILCLVWGSSLQERR